MTSSAHNPLSVSVSAANAVNPVYRARLIKHKIGIFLSTCAMAVGIFFLMWILITLFSKGFGSLNWEAIVGTPAGAAEKNEGLSGALLGSLLMVTTATLISTPIGILAGVYLAEYGEDNWFSDLTRFVTDIMLSAPSVVIGLFVYAIYVSHVKHFSGWAGSFAIALIAVPVVVRTTDNMLALVPTSLREAAFALGAPRWKVALFIRIKAVKAGILTGILLAVARISGETAPLLFTAFGNQFLNTDMNKPMSNLPQVIYSFATSPDEKWIGLAWTGALLLTFSVLALNILSRTVFSQKTQN
ncbi:MAG: phosphate ABC transporter permease PstA [Undibacterium sp.]|nr:phosphate ABC transporter permease PstA [Undibacterium sp.]